MINPEHKKAFFVLAVVVIVVSTLLTVFFGSVTNDRVVDVFLEEETIHAGALADQAAFAIQNQVISLRGSLLIAATKADIKNFGSAVCAEKMTEVFEIVKGRVGNLARIGPDKNFYCSVNKDLNGKPVGAFGDFVDPLFKNPSLGVVASHMVISPGNLEKVVAVHVPVFSASGEFNGTIGGAIYLSNLKNFMSRVALKQGRNNSVLLDDDGTILYHGSGELVGKNVFKEEDVRGMDAEESSLYRSVAKAGDISEVRFANYRFGSGEGQVAYRSFEVIPGRVLTVFVPVAKADAERVVAAVNSENIALVALVSDLGLIGLIFLIFYLVRKRKRS